MRVHLNPCLYLFLVLMFYTISQAEEVTPPVADVIPAEMEIHGDIRVDNYYWLRDRENPAVIEYLAEENLYTETMMTYTEELQNVLFNEMVERIKQEDSSVPYLFNGYFYYKKYEEGNEYPIYARKKDSPDAPEEIMLDVNPMAEEYTFFNVSGMDVSPENTILAYGVDTLGNYQYTVHFLDLQTGELLEDRIDETTGNITWANDSRTVFYGHQDSTFRPDRIIRHRLGTETEVDVVVYHEDDPMFLVYIYNSKSQKYIFLCSESKLSSEILFLDADDPEGLFTTIQSREENHEYSVCHYNNYLYILTNSENAVNFRLVKTPVNTPSRENWEEVITADEEVLLQHMEIFSNFLVISERYRGLSQLRVIDLDDMSEHYIDFPEEAYSVYMMNNLEFDTNLLRFGYTSMTTPWSTFDYNMETREKILLKQEEVGGFNPADYQTERIFATASDGTEIPISLVYRTDMLQNEGNPLLLYGYGSYGVSIDAAFSSCRLSLLDRGFTLAIAHVRGGQEMGRYWYEDGKLLNKRNTFTDFITCAEHLIAEGYTNSDILYAQGGSAGGLLIGAVINMSTDLFRGVIANMPFVDVMTTMLDESIPLTTFEYEEWGNPSDPEYYDYMLSYSPYDNVEEKNYPAMLVTTGWNDTSVGYWEPAKWVAKLRVKKTDDNILLLYTEMESGHMGITGRFKWLRQLAMQYAFLLDLTGIRE